MASEPELDIELKPVGQNAFTAEFRFQPGNNDALQKVRKTISLPLDDLARSLYDPREYGTILSDRIFADATVLEQFRTARSSLQTGPGEINYLRIRLQLCEEVQSVCWETLQDPVTSTPLFANPRILLSRFLGDIDWRPNRPRGEISALVVIASPSNLSQFGTNGRPFDPIDVDAELRRIRTALPTATIDILRSPGGATMNDIVRSVRSVYDALYLVCHGAMVDGEPKLFLENERGLADIVAGPEFVRQLTNIRRPALVILASCQSAGKGLATAASGATAGTPLGTLLVDAGIPTVLAMQGEISADTSGKFMTRLFEELQQDGQIDRAAASARASVAGAPDYWMPVLMTRLSRGLLWQTEASQERNKTNWLKWDAVLYSIRRRKRCIPILGPDLTEPIVGATRDIARTWAETLSAPYPLAVDADLPQVAQYVAVTMGREFMPMMLSDHILADVSARHRAVIAEEWGREAAKHSLEESVSLIGRSLRAQDMHEPHRLLAQMPFSLYLTASPFSLISDALHDERKVADIELCPWNHEHGRSSPDNGALAPTVDAPLVYHLFGRLSDPESLVVKEDDYFRYLIGFTRNYLLIPPVVREALNDGTFLFLGFQLDDWRFRVLFHSILNPPWQTGTKTHVAVQVDPALSHFPDPERARQYLESYFGFADISVYWGDVKSFIKDLHERL